MATPVPNALPAGPGPAGPPGASATGTGPRTAAQRWNRVFPVLLSLVILAPQCSTEAPGWNGLHLGPAQIMGGDEEAYLLLVNSAILDGDLDLANDHARVMQGAPEAGAKNAGRIVDHHSTYYVNGQRLVWRDLVDRDLSHWRRDPDGLPRFVFRPGIDPALAAGPEYSAHPVGIAFVLAPLLFPFRHTPFVEQAAILCAGLATVATMLLLRRLLRRFTADERAIQLTLVAVFLSTPLWYHSRSFFNESFIALLTVAAVVLALEPRGAFFSGLCVAAGMLMKPQSALLVPPLMLPFLLRREWRQLVLLSLMPAAAVGLLLWLNAHMYGSPWRGPYPWAPGNLLDGLSGLLVLRQKGLVWFAPAILFAVLGFPRLVRERPLEGWILVACIVPSYLLVAAWADWGGGWCYGPRLLVPILPLMGVGLVKTLELRLFQRFVPRWLLANAIAFGVAVNALGAFRYWESWHQFPLHMLAMALGAISP